MGFFISEERDRHGSFDLAGILSILDKVYLSIGKPDERLCKPDAKDQFSIIHFIMF